MTAREKRRLPGVISFTPQKTRQIASANHVPSPTQGVGEVISSEEDIYAAGTSR